MRNSTLIFSAAVAINAIVGIGATSAADLPARTYTKAPPMVDPAYNWTGFYVGANAGYAWGSTNVVYTPPGGPDGFIPADVITYAAGASQRLNSSGFTGGGQAGYNYQINRFLLGLEGDVGYLSRSSQFTGTFVGVWGTQNVNISGKDGWLATIRGRVGVTFDRFLVYGTGGVAFTDAGVNIGNNWNPAIAVPRDASTSVGNARAGWAAGGGVEYALQQNWSVKLEYLRLQFDSASPTVFTLGMLNQAATVTHQYNVDFTDNVVRVGVNYKFGAPVVAKY